MPEPSFAEQDPRWRVTPTKAVVAVLLLVAIVVPLLVGSYSRVQPRLLGFPFFYWYQLVWVFFAAGICFTSYQLLRRERDAYARRRTEHDATHGTGPQQGGGAR